MIANWGLEFLRSGTGVIDVGGEPGFVASVLLGRGIPASVVDPSWRMTGKTNRHTAVELFQAEQGSPKFTCFHENFDTDFYTRHREFVDGASAIISLYGDEATQCCLEVAILAGKPCAVIPCNECVRFFPPQNQTYDGYVQACVDLPNEHGGRFERVLLQGAPFSQALVVQPPCPAWLQGAASSRSSVEAQLPASLPVPIEVLRELGVLHQVLWKLELNRQNQVSAPE